MKNRNLLLITAAIIIACLSSCTMEKRLYMPGYHVGWNTGKPHIKEQELAKNNTTKEVQAENIKTIEPTLTTEPVEPYLANNVEVNNNIMTASVDNSFTLPVSTKINLNSNIDKVHNQSNINPSEDKTIIKKQNKLNKKAIKTAIKTSENGNGKSQLIALILCFVVGVFGIHRFYLGYTGIGILMLLTGGLCGILILIDFIRIILGDLGPKGGSYTTTL